MIFWSNRQFNDSKNHQQNTRGNTMAQIVKRRMMLTVSDIPENACEGRSAWKGCECPLCLPPLPLWQQCPPDKDQYIRLSLSPILCPHSLALYIRIFGNKLDIYRAEEIFTDKVHYIFWLSNVTTYSLGLLKFLPISNQYLNI